METILKFKIDFDNSESQSLLQFISDAKDGKFTAEKPDLAQITYKRLEIQEQEGDNILSQNIIDEPLLFGITY